MKTETLSRKVLSCVLTVTMLFSVLIFSVRAGAEGVEFEGEGTPDSPLQIDTEEKLLEFKRRVKGDGQNYAEPSLCAVLTADLTFDDWTIIGTTPSSTAIDDTTPYSGIFDGNGRTLTLTNDATQINNIALFHTITSEGVVKNLDLYVNFNGNTNMAGVAVRLYGLIDHVTVRGTITSTKTNGSSYTAGIAVYCGLLQTGASKPSGEGTILHCLNAADLIGGGFTAGITVSFAGEMRYCANTGNITSPYGSALGGLLVEGGSQAAYPHKVTVSDCYNAGNVIYTGTATNATAVGFFGGSIGNLRLWDDFKITNVFNLDIRI